MSEDELELGILSRFVAQHAEADRLNPDGGKCLRELDLRQVLFDITAIQGPELDHLYRVWKRRLVGTQHGPFAAPLRACTDSSKNRTEHKHHARAFLGDRPLAWDRIAELKRAGVHAPKRTHMAIRLFISHSSADKAVAERLIELLRDALSLRAEEIRCTSVEGHRLPGGADTDEEIRREINEAEAFIGIVSADSVQSLYVLFELGARWGLGKPLVPLLCPGFAAELLDGPLKGLNALRMDNRQQVLQLVHEIGRSLGADLAAPQSYAQRVDAVVDQPARLASNAAGGASSGPRQPAARRLNVEERDLVAGLSEVAGELLRHVANDANGALEVMDRTTGMSVTTGGRELVEGGAGRARSVQRWLRAIRELCERNLLRIEDGDPSMFKLTPDGYHAADLLDRLDSSFDPYLGSN
ncbi:MAG: toll/interleukin-1 receptor domain-containing protein [Vicinamibacterales bacterium]